jgi:glycosyltransferase involved in cell wall biosynthesis
MGRFSIAFATRELWPFVTGGGIGRVLHSTTALLAPEAEVTVITREAFRDDYDRMCSSGDPRLPHPDVRFEFIRDPEGFELGPFSSFAHCWSALVYERLCDLYPDGGPDLVEFNDYMGEGSVTTQARRSGHPSMRNTRVLVRLHTSLEMVDSLNGTPESEELRAIYTLERGSLARADHILSPSSAVISAYRRFYGDHGVAPPTHVPPVIALPSDEPTREPPPGSRTRLLYVGRLQRIKGVEELIRAATRLERDDWELTLVGGDTDTGPDGGSMRDHLQQLASGHERIRLQEAVPHERVIQIMDEHQVLVIPSHWECWSVVAREALSRNRPVLATPVGALPDAAVVGMSGWVAEGTDTEQIESALVQVLDSRDETNAMIRDGGPRRRLDDLLDPDAVVAIYTELAANEPGHTPAPQEHEPATVTAVVVCSSGSGPVDRTLATLSRQLVPPDEIVLVCDGLERLPAGFNSDAVDVLELLPAGAGPDACRNAGCELAGSDLILLLEAGMELEPPLLQRLHVALENNPDAAYATSWAHGLDPRAVPFGNHANFVPEFDNCAVAPLVRREVFDRGHRFDPSRGGCAERAFWFGLADDGLLGQVVPERLASHSPFSRDCGDASLFERVERSRSERADPLAWIGPATPQAAS